MRNGSSTWGAIVAALVLGACGGDDASPASSTDGGGGGNDGTAPTDGSGGGDASGGSDASNPTDSGVDAPRACTPSPADGGACNSLAPSGQPIAPTCSKALPPVPMGGIVVDGTYVLTQTTYFGPCPPAEQDRIAWQICGDAWQSVQEASLNGQPAQTTTLNATVGKNGAELSYQFTCPQNMKAATGAYDATPTTLTLYFTTGNTTRADVFAKQ